MPRRGRGGRAGDVFGRPFPAGDWGEPAERLEQLYQWVEQEAMRAADWYLHDRVWKRRGARLLRFGAALGVAAGAALPMLELAGTAREGIAVWGYLALLGAALCVGCDRYFGLTSGWMRDVATAQAVQRRLEALRYDWAAESVREVLGPAEGTASEAAERCLSVLRRFSEDITDLVRSETVDWMLESRVGGAPALMQTAPLPLVGGGLGAVARAEGGQVVRGGRFPLQASRASMPRQRPPEGPRG
nr:SLATT domain-containing protein [Streptomyces sp. YIM 98790]